MTTTDIDWRATLMEALNAPGALGNTYTRFYNYSFLNQIRLLMQGVAEPVATYNCWHELGRQVRKGSKAKIVLAPVLVGREVKDANGNVVLGDDGRPRKHQILVGFRDSRTVFGYSDTDGQELPPVQLPDWDVDTALAVLGIDRVPFGMINGNVQGFSFEDAEGRHVAINPTAAYPAKTLFHELAHLLLGHCKQGDTCGPRRLRCRRAMFGCRRGIPLRRRRSAQFFGDEVGGRFGLEFGHASVRITRIFAAVNKILTAGRVGAAEAVAA
jgi:hypothetical protein